MPRVLFPVNGKPEKVEKRRPNLSSLNGQSTSTPYYDAFRRKIIPSDSRLVEEYKRTIYTCANLNADGVAATPLRLFVKTEKGEKSTVLQTRPLSSKKIDFLQSKPHLSKTLRSFINVEEVIDHPILTLLEKANDSRHLNGQRLKELIQLYQDITGQAYILIETDPVFKLPKNLWILPSQWVCPIKKFDTTTQSGGIVDHYRFFPPGLASPVEYQPDEIIPFLMPSVMNPYVLGMSPLEASFEANEVNKKLLTHEDGLLGNEARPEVVISPKDTESAFSADTARRYEREWRLKFGHGRSGGAWVPDDPVTLTPVTIPPRDLARLEINKWSKNDVANAFQVPFALIADASHNRQQLEAAELQHAKHAILPRLNRNVCVLNDLLLRLYDDTGRLFLAYDDPIPENREEKLKENIQLKINGVKTANEVRDEYGMPPLSDPEADKLMNINVSPELARENNSPKREE